MPDPEEERQRIAALRRLAVLDSEPEAVFDDLVWLAASACNAPCSVISLIDSERQWFKARFGIDATQTPRELAFCARAILDDELLYVPDASTDPRFSMHPLVIGEPYLRFYAGAPLIGRDGARYGTLCVFDTKPRTLTRKQQAMLKRLAAQAVAQLESRRGHLQAKARDTTLANLIEALPDGVISCDADGRLRLLNRAAEQWFGPQLSGSTPDTRTGLVRLLDEHGRAELPLDQYPLARALRGEQVRHETVVVQAGDAPARAITCSAEPLRSLSGEPAGAVAVLHDVTGVRSASARLAESEARLRVTLQSIEDGVIATDTAGRITFLNERAAKLLWTPDWAALGQPLADLFRVVSEATDEPVADPVADTLRDGNAGPLVMGTALVQPDETRIAIEYRVAPIRDAGSEVLGAVLVMRDISEARQLAKAIEYQSTHDALTGLSNRHHLDAQLRALLAEPDAATTPHAVLLVDLDQFQVINDTCGHAAGDELLKQAAATVRRVLRASDLLARYGGDEFAVVLRNCRGEDAARVAEQVRAAVESMRFEWTGKPFATSVSIGVVAVEGECNAAELLSLAGSACHLAKEKGRNRVYLHRPGDADIEHRRDELGWVSRIQLALEEDRFVLFAQQILALAGPTQPHYEVLVRMRDEDGRLVPPMAFIPAAERYGLMQPIDRWVVKRSLAWLAGCRRLGHDPMLSINLSGRTLGDDTFLAFVAAAFEQHAVPFSQVCFEVTETAAIANLAQAEKFIDWFKQRGCQFSLDDFGSGMSSFAYLKRLRVDFLKIDGAFVRNLLQDKVDEAMVSAIHNVGRVMGLQTVAEFVEDEQTIERLRAMGVDFAQGYGIHRPEPLEGLAMPAAPARGRRRARAA